MFQRIGFSACVLFFALGGLATASASDTKTHAPAPPIDKKISESGSDSGKKTDRTSTDDAKTGRPEPIIVKDKEIGLSTTGKEKDLKVFFPDSDQGGPSQIKFQKAEDGKVVLTKSGGKDPELTKDQAQTLYEALKALDPGKESNAAAVEALGGKELLLAWMKEWEEVKEKGKVAEEKEKLEKGEQKLAAEEKKSENLNQSAADGLRVAAAAQITSNPLVSVGAQAVAYLGGVKAAEQQQVVAGLKKEVTDSKATLDASVARELAEVAGRAKSGKYTPAEVSLLAAAAESGIAKQHLPAALANVEKQQQLVQQEKSKVEAARRAFDTAATQAQQSQAAADALSQVAEILVPSGGPAAKNEKDAHLNAPLVVAKKKELELAEKTLASQEQAAKLAAQKVAEFQKNVDAPVRHLASLPDQFIESQNAAAKKIQAAAVAAAEEAKKVPEGFATIQTAFNGTSGIRTMNVLDPTRVVALGGVPLPDEVKKSGATKVGYYVDNQRNSRVFVRLDDKGNAVGYLGSAARDAGGQLVASTGEKSNSPAPIAPVTEDRLKQTFGNMLKGSTSEPIAYCPPGAPTCRFVPVTINGKQNQNLTGQHIIDASTNPEMRDSLIAQLSNEHLGVPPELKAAAMKLLQSKAETSQTSLPRFSAAVQQSIPASQPTSSPSRSNFQSLGSQQASMGGYYRTETFSCRNCPGGIGTRTVFVPYGR